MKRTTIAAVSIITILASVCISQAAEKISTKQKKKLSSLLQSIDKKGKEKKPRKHEIAVPVATAGVRGSEIKISNQFAVVWPGLNISPLSALAENLKHDAEKESSAKALRTQVEEFLRTFPEFSEEPLLKETLEALK